MNDELSIGQLSVIEPAGKKFSGALPNCSALRLAQHGVGFCALFSAFYGAFEL